MQIKKLVLLLAFGMGVTGALFFGFSLTSSKTPKGGIHRVVPIDEPKPPRDVVSPRIWQDDNLATEENAPVPQQVDSRPWPQMPGEQVTPEAATPSVEDKEPVKKLENSSTVAEPPVSEESPGSSESFEEPAPDYPVESNDE